MSEVTDEVLPIPESEVVGMETVADGVHGLRILFVNVFGVEHADGTWTMIDAGVPYAGTRIRHWVERTFGKAPRALVLTHGHFDHAGSAGVLAEEWQIPVYAHRLEMPYLTGVERYPPPNPGVGGGVMALLSPLYPAGPFDLGDRVRELPEDGTIPGMPGWAWLHTPGHTVGHVSLFREEDRALLVGDAFCTVKQESLMAVMRDKPELHGPPAYYTPDFVAAKASIEKLAALYPNVLIPGHGQPIAGDAVAEQLGEFADRFERLAIPESKG